MNKEKLITDIYNFRYCYDVLKSCPPHHHIDTIYSELYCYELLVVYLLIMPINYFQQINIHVARQMNKKNSFC